MRGAGGHDFAVGERPRRLQRLAHVVGQRVRALIEQVAALAAFLGEDERPECPVPSLEGQRGLDDLVAQGREAGDGGAGGRGDVRVDGASFRIRTPGDSQRGSRGEAAQPAPEQRSEDGPRIGRAPHHRAWTDEFRHCRQSAFVGAAAVGGLEAEQPGERRRNTD